MAYDISKAIYSNTFVTLRSTLNAFVFNDVGTKMYTISNNSSIIYEYDLSIPWSIGSASYVQLFNTSLKETYVFGLHFNTDGTKMYVAGKMTGTISEYNLGAAWDISSAVYFQNLSIPLSENYGIAFSTDGTHMYILGYIIYADFGVFEYALSSAWNISTASFTTVNTIIEDISHHGSCITFRPGGKRMYVTLIFSVINVKEFLLETAWNISTISTLYSHNFAELGYSAGDIQFDDVGNTLYISNHGNDNMYEYSLTNSKTRVVKSAVIPPPPPTAYGWFGGGTTGSTVNTVDRISFSNDTVNALDRCDLFQVTKSAASFADNTYGWFGGGLGGITTDIVQRITIADDTTNALDRCNLSVGRYNLAAFADTTYGWFGGGYTTSQSDRIDRITLADDTTNALDRCNLTIVKHGLAAFADTTYGWFGGGWASGSASTVIERITLANDTVNAISRCNMTKRNYSAAITDNTHGWFGGGVNGGYVISVERIVLANDTINALYRCDISLARYGLTAVTDNTYGWFAGGFAYTDLIDRITLANDTVNAIDRCNLTELKSNVASFSGTI